MENAFQNYQIPQQKKAPKYYFQEVALKALEYIEQPKKSVIFKWAKNKPEKLETSLRYMKDKNKKHFLYLAKLMQL